MKTILICDNETVTRKNLKAMLACLGFDNVIECKNGKSAVEMALASFPDMAVLDASMPEMDGITAATAIRNKLKIPIILMSKSYDGQTVKRAVECKIAALLNKPLRKDDLLPAIELAIAHNEEVEELKETIEDLKETIENRKVIEKAKGLLMEKGHIGEAEAYRLMQKLAMDKRKTLKQIADGILKN